VQARLSANRLQIALVLDFWALLILDHEMRPLLI